MHASATTSSPLGTKSVWHAKPTVPRFSPLATHAHADVRVIGAGESVNEIAAGEGALLRDDGRLLAVYRSGDGGLQAVSAACTHLGCAVRWNADEQSCDCPCHGSRFTADGALLHGPQAGRFSARQRPRRA